MLFVALTRSDNAELLLPRSARKFSVAPDWFLTCVADGFLSRLSVSDDEIAVSESLLADTENQAHDVDFVVARFLRTRQVLQIGKSGGSGRPVYYSVSAKGEFFLSSHLALLRQAGVQIEEDPAALPELLAYRVVAPPRTLFRGIRQLWLSGSLAVEVKGENLQLKEPAFGYEASVASRINSTADPARTVADLLNASVARLVPIAPRVATLLSGGVDSSILSAIARDVLAACDTYSTSYPFDSPATSSEQVYALSAASALATRHTLFTPTVTDYLTGFVDALANAESPLDHLQSVLLHLLFKDAVPDRFDRIICGEAADSAFGLATQFMLRQPPKLRDRVCSLLPFRAGLRALGSCWARARDFSEVITQLNSLHLPVSDPSNPIWSHAVYGDFDWIRTHYGASRDDIIGLRSQYLERAGNLRFNDMFAIYALNFDVGLTTTVWSKLAEGQRKILYYPFASPDVLDAAFSIPWETKLKSEKHVIREIGQKLGVPALILNRPKQSFGIMSDRWAVKGGAMEPLIAVAAKVVDIEQLRALQGTDSARAMTLWSLLNYAVLKRLFVMGEHKQTLIDEVLDNARIQANERDRRGPRSLVREGSAGRSVALMDPTV
jgi:asparagine synthetase B (glutamine-hydrolysing)